MFAYGESMKFGSSSHAITNDIGPIRDVIVKSLSSTEHIYEICTGDRTTTVVYGGGGTVEGLSAAMKYIRIPTVGDTNVSFGILEPNQWQVVKQLSNGGVITFESGLTTETSYRKFTMTNNSGGTLSNLSLCIHAYPLVSGKATLILSISYFDANGTIVQMQNLFLDTDQISLEGANGASSATVRLINNAT